MVISELNCNLILTFDYELFGDGSGNVFTHIIDPTNKILRICDEYGIKITIFIEAIEYIKLKEEWNKGNKMGYTLNPIEAIETQIQNAAKSGHDIQLHVHPQWVNAKYINGKWELDRNNCRLGDFHATDGYRIYELLSDGKNELENLILSVLPEYKCIAFRAGYFNIMPSKEVYKSMKELDLKIDSSVYPGGFEKSSLQKYDYRKVPIHLDLWWADETDIRKESKLSKEILEIPVFALAITPWLKVLTPSRMKSLLRQTEKSMSSGRKEKFRTKSFLEKIRFMVQKEATPWDVCTFPKFLHKKFFSHIEKKLLISRDNFVLIGHPKDLQDEELFRTFIEIAHKRKKTYLFKTLREVYEEVI